MSDDRDEGPEAAATAEPLLTIALATTEGRIETIDLDGLPVDPRWRYLVICQCGNGTTGKADDWLARAKARRPDVSLRSLSSSGVARSRNAALEACASEVLLFTDDDVRLVAVGLCWIISTFAADPSLCLLAGQTLLGDGAPAKRYPARAHGLRHFNSARIGTVELAVRPRRVRDSGVWFDADFGAGAPYRLGDEYIFVTDCLKRGLRGKYGPVAIAIHRGRSSGDAFSGTAEDRGRVFERVFNPLLTPLVKLAFLVRHWRRLGSPASAWQFARAFLPFHRN
jgi:hypothetical protein